MTLLRRLLSIDRRLAVADTTEVSAADSLSFMGSTPTTAQMFCEVKVRGCSFLATDANVLHDLERDNEISNRSADKR